MVSTTQSQCRVIIHSQSGANCTLQSGVLQGKAQPQSHRFTHLEQGRSSGYSLISTPRILNSAICSSHTPLLVTALRAALHGLCWGHTLGGAVSYLGCIKGAHSHVRHSHAPTHSLFLILFTGLAKASSKPGT